MSGQPGNVCIAGHRVTARMHPFRHLEMMAPGDYVFVQYQEHVYTYETLETFVISNTDVSVMRAVPGEPHLLTLITCHPPGSARERLILRGRLILVDDRPPEEFFSPPTPETTPDASTPSDAPESPNAAETPPDISPPGSGEEAPVSTEPSVPADEPPPDGSPLPGAEPAPESNAPDTENAAAIEPSPPDLSGN
jgi:LPXTG-site transpeptidase (sortase) family protein